MCEKLVSKHSFMLNLCFNRYKTQEIRDKAVDGFLPTLKLDLFGKLGCLT